MDVGCRFGKTRMEMVRVIDGALRDTVLHSGVFVCVRCSGASFSDFPVMKIHCFCNKKLHLFPLYL